MVTSTGHNMTSLVFDQWQREVPHRVRETVRAERADLV